MTKSPERLSNVELTDNRILPPTYLNRYQRLLEIDPVAAIEFFNTWAFVPKTAQEQARRKAIEALRRATQVMLKRRI